MVFSNLAITAYCIFPYFDPVAELSGSIVLGIYQLFFILAGVSHLRCSLTDPGLVPPIDSLNDTADDNKVCFKCEQLKPPRVHHCSTCKRCVFKVTSPQMDHHCPWVNNCVGALNMKFFLLFCFYIAAMSLATLIIQAYCAYIALSDLRHLRIKPFQLGCCVIVGLIGLVFLTFTVSMAVEQLEYVIKNQTYIESLKNSRGASCSLSTALGLVFGKSAWLLPTSPNLILDFSETVHDDDKHSKSGWDADSVLMVVGLSCALTVLAGLLVWIYRLSLGK
jgi:palmitoyltransferase